MAVPSATTHVVFAGSSEKLPGRKERGPNCPYPQNSVDPATFGLTSSGKLTCHCHMRASHSPRSPPPTARRAAGPLPSRPPALRQRSCRPRSPASRRYSSATVSSGVVAAILVSATVSSGVVAPVDSATAKPQSSATVMPAASAHENEVATWLPPITGPAEPRRDRTPQPIVRTGPDRSTSMNSRARR